MLRKLPIAFASLILSLTCHAQNFNAELVDSEFHNINRKGMLSLGSWAIANVAVSGFSLGNTTGEARAFHEMNLGWNAVNALIAGGAYWYSTRSHGEVSAAGVWERHRKMKQVFLFNAGLDVAYVVGGFYLREKALSDPVKQDQWRGYGNAVIMNGAFLLVFDAVMFWVHEKHGQQAIYPNLSFNGNSLSLKLNF